MRAIVIDAPGDASVMHIGEVATPVPGPGEIRIRVAATAVNRADLLQRQGKYPPPAGASEILGLECAGTVSEVGDGVTSISPGDRVMALLAGGGYAEEAVVDVRCAVRVPDAITLAEAAALPEACFTVFGTVFQLGALDAGEAVLVHGGASGIGTTAITLVRLAGGRAVVTAGSDEKCARCTELGAALAINYRRQDFAEAVAGFTGGRGVDVVLDSIGSPYLERNLDCLAVGGRLVVIATMGGANAALDLRTLMRKRLAVIGSTLRARPVEEKAAVVAGFVARFGADLAAGRIRPVIDRIVPLEQAAEAHRVVEASEHVGKVVLRVAS